MKALGIAMVGLLAVAGGIAAATYITKKKLEKENDGEFFDDWDSDFDDDDLDFDFDDDAVIDGAPAEEKKEEAPASRQNDDLIEDDAKAEDAADEKDADDATKAAVDAATEVKQEAEEVEATATITEE